MRLKKQPLHPYLRKLNIEINKRRIGVEHVFGALKRFKILSYFYRNRRYRLGLGFNLIADIFQFRVEQKMFYEGGLRSVDVSS